MRISGFFSLFPAIAVFSAHFSEGIKNTAIAEKREENPEILTIVGTSVDTLVGRFVGPFVGSPRRAQTGKQTFVETFVGTLVGTLVGTFVGPLVGTLVDPLVGSNFAVRVLCASPMLQGSFGPFWPTKVEGPLGHGNQKKVQNGVENESKSTTILAEISTKQFPETIIFVIFLRSFSSLF